MPDEPKKSSTIRLCTRTSPVAWGLVPVRIVARNGLFYKLVSLNGVLQEAQELGMRAVGSEEIKGLRGPWDWQPTWPPP